MQNAFWYQNLIKPPLAPQDNIFAPVWSVLYALVFLSFLFYLLKDKENKRRGYVYFAVQMVLNFIWPLVFFNMKNIALALFVLLLLDRYIYLAMKEFYFVSKVSFYFLIPYFAWALFATYLNFGYLVLN